MDKDTLRKLIREILVRELDEMSTTGDIAGYSTPGAFAGNIPKFKKKMKDRAEQGGLKLTDKGKEELNRKADPVKHETIKDVNLKDLDEGKSKYHLFKDDMEKTPRQKIGIAIREARKSLKQIHNQLEIVTRYKNETEFKTDEYWKRTVKDLYKVESSVIGIIKKLREIRN